MAVEGRELPGIGDVGATLAERARGYPWGAIGAALVAGYLLGGGLFTRPTRWLFRAALGALAVPAVRERAVRASSCLKSRRNPLRFLIPVK